MSGDTLHLRELAVAMRRLWWIPVILAIGGLAVGLAAPSKVPVIYRAQATVLVGPTEGAVTHTSTVRTSENLAAFYADMARRQLVLEPVTQSLGLEESWAELRNKVKAVVPPQNLRLVTVTVMGDTQEQADAVANGLVRELVSLSPALPGGNSQAFINEQVDMLKETIRSTQENIDRLEAEAEAATTPEMREQLRQEALGYQDRLVGLQRAYVELIAAEPTTDAGGLTVLDEASAVTDLGRPTPARQALVGAALGGAMGVAVAWLRHRRRGSTDADARPDPVVDGPDHPAGTGHPSVGTPHTDRDVDAPVHVHTVRRGSSLVGARVPGARRRDPTGA